MGVFDQPMRSLTVCKVSIDPPSTKKKEGRSKLFNILRSKAAVTPREEYLLILSCDRLAIIKGEDSSTDDSGSEPSPSTPAASLADISLPVISLPLSLIQDVAVDSNVVIIEYHNPSPGKGGGGSTSPYMHSPPSSASLATASTHHHQSLAVSKGAATTATATESVNNDDIQSMTSTAAYDAEERSAHFPFITNSFAAVGRLVRGGGSGIDDPSQMKLYAETEAAAEELGAVLRSALNRILEAYLWLDRGLPLDLDASMAVSTISYQPSPQSPERVILRSPFWGRSFPLSISRSSSTTGALHVDVSTPLGPCHAIVTTAQLEIAARVGGRITVPAKKDASVVPAQERPSSGELGGGVDDQVDALYNKPRALGVQVTLLVTRLSSPASLSVGKASKEITAVPAPTPFSDEYRAPKRVRETQKKTSKTGKYVILLSVVVVVAAVLFSSSVATTLSPPILASLQCLLSAIAGASLWSLRQQQLQLQREESSKEGVGAVAPVDAATPLPVPTTATTTDAVDEGGVEYGIRLLHAELVEGPEEGEEEEEGEEDDVFEQVPAPHPPSAPSPLRSLLSLSPSTKKTSLTTSVKSTTTTTTTAELQPALTRQLTKSLTLRSKYLDTPSASVTAEITSISSQRPTTSTGPGTGVSSGTIASKPSATQQTALIDLGAVTLRRVVTRTTTRTTTRTVELAIPSDQAQEARELSELRNLSPGVTFTLFERYIQACSGDRALALARLRATAEWRHSHDIDNVLKTPAPKFHAIKAAYLHAVVGWTRPGAVVQSTPPTGTTERIETNTPTARMPVIVEGMGRFKVALAQLRKQNITPADMIYQFIFFVEWVLNDLTPGPMPAGQFIRIYDLKGVGLLDIADKEAIRMGQEMMNLLEKHYPERMARAYVVNTPSFFATAWRMVKPLLDPRTAQKIRVLSNKKLTFEALKEIMDEDQIPVEYGGKNPAGGYELGYERWYQDPDEKKLSAFVERLNHGHEKEE